MHPRLQQAARTLLSRKRPRFGLALGLKLHGVDSVDDSAMADLLRTCTRLHRLKLHACAGISRLDTASPSLRSLSTCTWAIYPVAARRGGG